MRAHPSSQQLLDSCTHQAASHHGEGGSLQCSMLGLASMGRAGLYKGLNHTWCPYRAVGYARGLAPAHSSTCSAIPVQCQEARLFSTQLATDEV